MRVFLYRLTLLFTLLLAACTTMQEIHEDEKKLSDLLQVGDHIIVYEKSGRIVDMRFVRVDGTILRGSLFNNGLVTVAIEVGEIEKIEAERLNAGRTTVATIGGIVLLPLAAVGLGVGLAEL